MNSQKASRQPWARTQTRNICLVLGIAGLIIGATANPPHCLADDASSVPKPLGEDVAGLAPTIIYPHKVRPNDAKSPAKWDLTLLSTLFTKETAAKGEMYLYLNSTKHRISPVASDNTDASYDTQVTGTFSNGQLDLSIPWKAFGDPHWPCGVVEVQVEIDGKFTKLVKPLVSGVETPHLPALYAAILTIVIVGLPIFIVSRSVSSVPITIAGKKYGIITALFLESETNTYSLSKLQFYVWTLAGIFGYLVLAIAQSLIQGHWVFPEIPPGLPAIILISGATTATAVGITASKGTKGAGPVFPGLADLVSTGGLIVPERFQFCVWTLVGVATFLFLVIASDPGSIQNLPQIPVGFLALMGISSAGYLGGKIARNAGPTIREIPVVAPGSSTVIILGQYLGQDASFLIDGKAVSSAAISVTGSDPADGSDQPEYFNKLTLYFKQVSDDSLDGGKHSLTIVNSDKQSAAWYYNVTTRPTVKTITAAYAQPSGDTPATLTLVLDGSELSKDAKNFKLDSDDIDPAQITVVDRQNPDEAAVPPTLYKNITVRIENPRASWITAGVQHKLVINNPDGSASSECRFTIPS